MKNNKHSVEVRFKQLTGLPSVKGGSLPSEFILDHMHFHWESEHTIDGKRYPLELHLVHYDARHGNISEAKKMKDGLAVLGVLFNVSSCFLLRAVKPVIKSIRILFLNSRVYSDAN